MKLKNYILSIVITLFISPILLYSQVDTTKVDTLNVLKIDTLSNISNKVIKVSEIDSLNIINTEINNNTQTDTSNQFSDMGVAVSPSSMHLNIKPGKTVTKEISIFNDTKKPYKFKIGFSDFEMGRNGKPTTVKSTESKYALSKWINLVPSFIELKPQEKGKIKLIISIPDEPESYRSAWTIVTIDESTERPKLDVEGNDKTIAMGVVNSIGFGVYVYQNPPNVKINSVEIQKFLFVNEKGKKKLKMDVRNIGDGIGYCSSYVEYTNINTGQKGRIGDKKFTILPQYFRDLYFDLPTDLPNGKYSAVGVLDFGSKEELVVAEIEFNVP